MSKWLDENNYFKRGRYRGEDLHDVADEDPGYLRWLLKEADGIEADEREIIEAVAG